MENLAVTVTAAAVVGAVCTFVHLSQDWHVRNRACCNFLNARGQHLFARRWEPKQNKQRARGIVFLCCGYGDCFHDGADGRKTHGLATLGEGLAAAGFLVCGIEQLGTGRSEGVRAHADAFEHLADDVLLHVRTVLTEHEGGDVSYLDAAHELPAPKTPCFLVGESMGGAVAIDVARRWRRAFRGVVLVAPMVHIDPEIVPPPPVIALMRMLRWLLPTAAIVPGASSDMIGICFGNEEMREYVRADPSAYRGRARVSMGAELLDASLRMGATAELHDLPTLLVQGAADVVCSVPEVKAWLDRSTSCDKTYLLKEGQWHSILSDDPACVEELAGKDGEIVEWISTRCGCDG